MRFPRKQLTCDYAIVGGGVGGLAAADALSTRFPRARIAVFEAEPKLGGRIRSKPLETGGAGDLAVIELGAGRYHPRRHRRVGTLIETLGIATTPFAFEMVRNTPGAGAFQAERTLDLLHRLRDSVPIDASFRSVVEAELGSAAFEALVELSGYDTLRRDELPFAHGFEIISSHPETESIWGTGPGEWRCLSHGFHQLPERLAARRGSNVLLNFNHRVTRLIRQDGAVVGLEAIGPRGTVEVACGHLICATSLYDMQALSPAACAAVNYRSQVVDVPLIKGYIEFERAFWPQAGRSYGICVITSSALRKVYFSVSQPRMFFYCDGSSAERLAASLAATSLLDRFLADLPMILPAVDRSQVLARRSGWQHWLRGISFWSGGRQVVTGPIWMPELGLAFLSDINTPELGWLEGALLAAEAIGSFVAAPSSAISHIQPSQPALSIHHP